MISNTAEGAQALNIGHPDGSFSQSSALRSVLAPTPSSLDDAELGATHTLPIQGSSNRQELEADGTTQNRSIERDPMPTATESTSRTSDRTGFRRNEELITTATVSWRRRTLSYFTLYGELSIAYTPEEFALVRSRLQQEWSFDGGFLVGIAAVNAAILAIPTDSIFKIDSYAYSAVATSSSACGLGIACDVWFLLRYNWVDSETFIYRSRDVYGSYVSFSLSSRMPTFFMLVSSISLMAFL